MAGSVAGRDSKEDPEPPRLRALRRLVTLLTITLIVGVFTVVTLLALRLTALAPVPAPAPRLPSEVVLPTGETARAVTFGTGWIAVVTVDSAGAERVRVLDAETGADRGTLEIVPSL